MKKEEGRTRAPSDGQGKRKGRKRKKRNLFFDRKGQNRKKRQNPKQHRDQRNTWRNLSEKKRSPGIPGSAQPYRKKEEKKGSFLPSAAQKKKKGQRLLFISKVGKGKGRGKMAVPPSKNEALMLSVNSSKRGEGKKTVDQKALRQERERRRIFPAGEKKRKEKTTNRTTSSNLSKSRLCHQKIRRVQSQNFRFALGGGEKAKKKRGGTKDAKGQASCRLFPR